jgi:hypothetical protein
MKDKRTTTIPKRSLGKTHDSLSDHLVFDDSTINDSQDDDILTSDGWEEERLGVDGVE